jgi:hypothetical protein
MSHWFDRLASWSADDRDDGEERLLTRRQAVRAAATGAGAIGLLGSPLIAAASAESAACACWRDALNRNTEVGHQLVDNLILTPSALISPLNLAIFTVAYTGLNAGTVAKAISCGSCDNDKVPSGKKPPPKFQPCTQRGGVRLRGDQCGGDGGGDTGGSGCSPGTSSCPTPTGGDLCCFGSDLCCSGCCCVESCGCCG